MAAAHQDGAGNFPMQGHAAVVCDVVVVVVVVAGVDAIVLGVEFEWRYKNICFFNFHCSTILLTL